MIEKIVDETFIDKNMTHQKPFFLVYCMLTYFTLFRRAFFGLLRLGGGIQEKLEFYVQVFIVDIELEELTHARGNPCVRSREVTEELQKRL